MATLYDKIKAGMIETARMMRQINRMIPVSGTRYDIDLGNRVVNMVYYPAKSQKAPLILGFHGGGFLFGGSAMNDAMWVATAEALDCNIASIDYRKSPDFGWREALDDAWDMALYMKEHVDNFGFDPDHLWTMGCSAGASIAARVCLRANLRGHQIFEKQILMYPFLDSDTDPEAKGNESPVDPSSYIFNELHSQPDEKRLPEVSPVFATPEMLVGIPDAIICVADRDNLKHEGKRYGEMLADAGAQVAFMESQGMPHGYYECGFGKMKPEELGVLGEGGEALVASGAVAKAAEESLKFVKNHL